MANDAFDFRAQRDAENRIDQISRALAAGAGDREALEEELRALRHCGPIGDVAPDPEDSDEDENDEDQEAAETALQDYADRPEVIETLTPRATYILARIIHDTNAADAVRLYKRAAEAGYPAANASVGEAYQVGDGVELDVSQAVRWFQQGADANDPDAKAYLGLAYCAGIGVEQNREMGSQLLRDAAASGSEVARNELTEREQEHPR